MARPWSRADRGSYALDTAQSTPEARTRVKLPPDPYQDDEPRPGRGRRPLVLLAALVALVAAITIVNRSTHHSGGSPTSGQSAAGSGSSNQAASPTGPVTSQFDNSGLPGNTADGVPIGYPHSGKGAESAAANYVVAYTSSTKYISSFWKPSPSQVSQRPPGTLNEKAPGPRPRVCARVRPAKSRRISSKAFT